MKRAAVLLTAAAAFFIGAPAFAAQRIEKIDKDKDGFKETSNIYEGDKLVRIELDKDKDGRPDTWIWVVEGASVRTWYDTDGDGRADKFYTMLKGRELMLREFDRNGDGKVDERCQVAWDANKTISIPQANGRMQHIGNPGYVTLWRERDTNFDGIIDEYTERGNKKASAKKVGKRIDPVILKQSPDEKNGGARDAKTSAKAASDGILARMVKEKNQKYDYNK